MSSKYNAEIIDSTILPTYNVRTKRSKSRFQEITNNPKVSYYKNNDS